MIATVLAAGERHRSRTDGAKSRPLTLASSRGPCDATVEEVVGPVSGSFLDQQAQIGISVHLGGLPATRRLHALCRLADAWEVLAELVLAFVIDKERAIAELVRVARLGGYALLLASSTLLLLSLPAMCAVQADRAGRLGLVAQVRLSMGVLLPVLVGAPGGPARRPVPGADYGCQLTST